MGTVGSAAVGAVCGSAAVGAVVVVVPVRGVSCCALRACGEVSALGVGCGRGEVEAGEAEGAAVCGSAAVAAACGSAAVVVEGVEAAVARRV